MRINNCGEITLQVEKLSMPRGQKQLEDCSRAQGECQLRDYLGDAEVLVFRNHGTNDHNAEAYSKWRPLAPLCINRWELVSAIIAPKFHHATKTFMDLRYRWSSLSVFFWPGGTLPSVAGTVECSWALTRGGGGAGRDPSFDEGDFGVRKKPWGTVHGHPGESLGAFGRSHGAHRRHGGHPDRHCGRHGRCGVSPSPCLLARRQHQPVDGTARQSHPSLCRRCSASFPARSYGQDPQLSRA
jgi:hypothetical protein